MRSILGMKMTGGVTAFIEGDISDNRETYVSTFKLIPDFIFR